MNHKEDEKLLKILYIAHERKLGGATRSLLALIDEMKKKGHEVYVIVPTKNCPLANELSKRNITIFPMFFAWWQMPLYWNGLFKFAFRVLYLLEGVQIFIVSRKIRRLGIDVIHTNSSVTDFGARLANKLKIKHVWHVREYGDADYNLEYMFGKDETWNKMNQYANKIIFISKDLHQYFLKYADNEKGIVIYNGIDASYLLEREYRKDEKVTFLIAGNLNRNKQQMLVLQAAKELVDRGITCFRVLVAGASSSMKDSQQYEQELKYYINTYLSTYVSMLGSVSEMRELRQQVDVEIVPSNREAFGRVTVEAMFAGIPVIASNTGANVELVEDGVTGLLFSNGEYMELADKMQFMIENPAYIQKWGEAAQNNSKEKYTAAKNGDMIEEVYFSVCG